VIVDPTNTQAINPYSYVMNNPLAYTDPSGYCTAVTGTKFCAETTSKSSGKSVDVGSSGSGSSLQQGQSQGNGAQNTGASSNNGNTSASGDTTKINGQAGVASDTDAFDNAIQNLSASEFLNNQINSSIGANPSAFPLEGGGLNSGRLLSQVGQLLKNGVKGGFGTVGLLLSAIIPLNETLDENGVPLGEFSPAILNEEIAVGLFQQLEASSDATVENLSNEKLYLFRIGGSKPSNLKLSGIEKTLTPPGKSLLISTDAQSAAAQFRTVTGRNDFSITGKISLAGVREAGFGVISNPTRRLPNHARLIHPLGVAGFASLENRQRLSANFTNIPTP
jgi:hypothetical protein